MVACVGAISYRATTSRCVSIAVRATLSYKSVGVMGLCRGHVLCKVGQLQSSGRPGLAFILGLLDERELKREDHRDQQCCRGPRWESPKCCHRATLRTATAADGWRRMLCRHGHVEWRSIAAQIMGVAISPPARSPYHRCRGWRLRRVNSSRTHAHENDATCLRP